MDDAPSYRADYLLARNASRGGVVVGRAEYTLDAVRRRTSLTDVDGTHTFGHDLAERHPLDTGIGLLAPVSLSRRGAG